MSKGLQIAVGAILVAVVLGWYAATNLESLGSFTYYQTLGEFRASAEPGARVRVHGWVEQGSIVRDVETRTVRFAVRDDPPHAGGPAGDLLPVVYASLETPDLFQDGAEVVVEGELSSRGVSAVFRADNVLAKCPSKFQAEQVEAASF